MTEFDTRQQSILAEGATSAQAPPDTSTLPGQADEIDTTKLRQWLVEQFSLEELKTLCADLHVKYDVLPGEDLESKARELIAYLGRRNRLPELAAICAQLRPPVSVGAISVEYSRPIRHGLNALAELMQTPEVRTAVVTFRAGFRAASEQIHRLAAYKQLHDLLHNLQFQCYGPLLAEVERAAGTELATDVLSGYEFTLQGILRDLKEVAGQTSLTATEKLWIQDVTKAHQALTGAVDDSDAALLKSAVRILKRVVEQQPTRINERLNEAAQNLRLPDLVDAMKQVSEHVTRLNLEAEKVEMFQAGVQALASLDERLTALVADHSQWQLLDLQLRRIESNLAQDLDELLTSWIDVKGLSESLCYGRTDECIALLCKQGTGLESAIAEGNSVQIKKVFKRYSRQASMCFYQVDVSLKRLCEDLRQVGDPLASVLRVIE
jgi:hypothetical protein